MREQTKTHKNSSRLERNQEREEGVSNLEYLKNIVLKVYWRELNLAVEPKIAIVRILADINSAVVV